MSLADTLASPFLTFTLHDGRKIAIRRDLIFQVFEADPELQEKDSTIKCVIQACPAKEDENGNQEMYEDIEVQEDFKTIILML